MLQAYYKGTNKKVRAGDVIKDFRNEEHIFENATRKTETCKSGKVCTNKGEFFATVFNLEVREYGEYEEKTLFVMDELRMLLQSINRKISNARYENFWRNGKIIKELVIIEFIDGHQKIIEVTCDSIRAIVQDVMKNI